MRIGSASYRCKNGDPAFNLQSVERAMKEAQGKAELLCFGESFLQGFDALCWDFSIDREIAVSRDSETIRTIREWTKQYGVGLLLGYIERDGERLYSSCIVIDNGEILHNYRRISKGWKEFDRTDEHYCEGTETGGFAFRGRRFMLSLCGDLWDFPERFQSEDPLIWPVWVCYSEEDWETEELSAYAAHAATVARDTLMINPLAPDADCIGGAFRLHNGTVAERIPFGAEGILYTDI